MSEMRCDAFYRTYNKVRSRSRTLEFSFTAPRDASIEDLLALLKTKTHRTGAAWGGWFEVQTDLGIWSHPQQRNLALCPKTQRVYKTWEQLEAEEA